MGRLEKPIDFDGIQKMMEDSPDNWWPEHIAKLRFDGLLKRMMGVALTQEEADALALE